MACRSCESSCSAPPVDARYRRILWAALGINAAMFAVEIGAALLSRSVAVQADALDFLGDAANYAVALLVLGMALRWRAAAALLKGTVMALFGLWVLATAVGNALAGTVPRAEIMGAVGLVALAANVLVAALLFGYRGQDSNKLSVWLCSRNDVIANLAVIAAGAGVWSTGTPWPDIAVAAVMATLGLSAALAILRKALHELRG